MTNPAKPVSICLSNHIGHWHRLTKDQQIELMGYTCRRADEAGWGTRVELLRLVGDDDIAEFRRRQIDEWMDDLPESIKHQVKERCRHLYMSRLHALQRTAPLRQP